MLIVWSACQSSQKDMQTLLDCYKDTAFNDLYVYSNDNDSSDVYFGKYIDSNVFNLLNPIATQGYSFDYEFFAVYSFKIDDHHTGLITRTPGLYSSSIVSLWVLDNQNDTIQNNIELADAFGDAGYTDEKHSFLYFDENKKLKVLSHFQSSFDNSVENPIDTSIEVTNKYFLIEIHPTHNDTISNNPTQLKEQFDEKCKKINVMRTIIQ
jgi:hypothetical protein